MGVVYKIQPEIRDFILGKKQAEPGLSCRQLTTLVLENFAIKVSKSSINSLFKTAGLSMPVGRRLKKRRIRREMEKPAAVTAESVVITTEPAGAIAAEPAGSIAVEEPISEAISREISPGAIFLKAADYLLGGTHYIIEAIKRRITTPIPDLVAQIESLLYGGANTGLSPYLIQLQQVRELNSDIPRIFDRLFQEVRCIKVTLSTGNTFYLDGQLKTVWSISHIPYFFSTTLYNIKSYINKYFQKEHPFLLFMAPGYDVPTKEFFDFILSFEAGENRISRLTLYGNRLEEIENITLDENKQRFFVFGLWPWQFTEYRKVKQIGEFRAFYFAGLKKDFYLAEIEIELLQPTVNTRVTLRGCALKTALSEKTRIVILGNLAQENAPPEALAGMYLNHWPNLEEAFQDYSRKVELFTYTASSQRFFSTEKLNFDAGAQADIPGLFNSYLEALDLYVRWYFLPAGYEEMDFSTTKERFYGLSAEIDPQKDLCLATFRPPTGYSFLKDLEYACRRINEREINFYAGLRLWCRI